MALFCLHYSPQFGGRFCEGESREYEVCNTDVCSIREFYLLYIQLSLTHRHVLMEPRTLEMCSVQILMICHLLEKCLPGNHLKGNVSSVIIYMYIKQLKF